MNKNILIVAGLLLMSGMVFAAGSGQKTYDRWTTVIQNTTEARDNLQEFDNDNNSVDLSPQLAQLQTKINTMIRFQSELDTNHGRHSQRAIIVGFQAAIYEAKAIIMPLLDEFDLPGEWKNLRAKD
ncbi:MAG: hypothetical protein HY392_04910 [Candidatus Diapherotrites archaeon]|nr:hypothetical protein [Candidatus Diapherotrites archaeon]